MKLNPQIPTYGDPAYRGDCRKEDAEQIDAVAWLRLNHPSHAALCIHPKNEGKRTWGQVAYEKKMGGIPTGASDFIVPGSPSFVCELKRKDRTKSQWQSSQQDYLINAKDNGCFVCVALGFEAFRLAFNDWLETQGGDNATSIQYRNACKFY